MVREALMSSTADQSAKPDRAPRKAIRGGVRKVTKQVRRKATVREVEALPPPLQNLASGTALADKLPAPEPMLAYTIKEFSRLHGFSVAYFYLMQQRGIGPKVMHAGGRRLIAHEEATAWRARLMEATAAQSLPGKNTTAPAC